MLQGNIVMVTGGAGKLGAEFVKNIAQNGGIAILADINEKLAKLTRDEIVKELKNENIDYVKIDITSVKSIQSVVERLNHKYGKIDALVNSAYPRGKNFGKDFLDITYEDFCENINLNLGGYFLTSQILAKYFLKQGFGNIINISSVYGVVNPNFEMYEGFNKSSPIEYSLAKAGVIHMSRYMAKSFQGKIRINTISPGGILNEENQTKEWRDAYKKYCLTKGMIDRSDLSGTLIYLLSDMSKYVNGQNIIVDDGFTL